MVKLYNLLKTSENRLIPIAVFFMFTILLINSPSAQTFLGDEDIIPKWRYSVDDDITALTVGKINNRSVVLVASGDTLYILDRNGNLTERYTIQTPGEIYEIEMEDIDEDDEDEILLGLGWMETKELNQSELYSMYDGIPEEEDLLYKVLKSKGSFYVIDGGKINRWDEVDLWVRSIIISDINGDDKDEVIVVSGGYQNNYFKRYTDIVYRHRHCWTEWEIKHTYYTEAECTCPGCFWDDESNECNRNETWMECEWEETTDKGWNFSESSLVNGSIVIFNKSGDLLSKSYMSEIEDTFWNADISNFYHDRDEEIIVGSGNKIYVFNYTGHVQASYEARGDVKKLYVLDINNDWNDEIIVGFRNSSSGISGVGVINREGKELWMYRMKPKSSISAMYMKTLDEHGVNEILLISEGILYVIDDSGQLDWSGQFKYNKLVVRGINRIFSTYLDDNSYEDLIATSNRMVYEYEIIGTFVKKQSADRYYALGKENYELTRYQEAKSYLGRARQLYLEADFSSGVSECDSLLEDITERLNDNRRAEADSQYARALLYYNVRDYESTKKYLNNARDIYAEINDSDGLLRCDYSMAIVEGILLEKNATTTTTTTTLTVTTTTTLPEESDIISLLSNPAILVGFLVIIFLIVAIFVRSKAPKGRKGKKKGKRAGEGVLLEDWEALDGEWEDLEE